MKNGLILLGATISLLVLYSDRTTLLDQLGSSPSLGAAMPVETLSLPEEVFYFSLQPEIVLNYEENDPTKFIMIDFSVATDDQTVFGVLEERDAELRRALLTLLAEKDVHSLNTRSGKRALREEAKIRLEEIIGTSGKAPLIKDVLLTRLIVR